YVVLVQLGALGPGPSAVFEDETVLEAGRFNQFTGPSEGLFAFSAKTDDEVAADRDSRHSFAAASEHVAVVFHGVKALHPLEDGITARLGGHVQVRADLGQRSNRIEQVVAHVPREIRDELDPLDASRVVNPCQQIGEPKTPPVAEAVLVAIDSLPQKGD